MNELISFIAIGVGGTLALMIVGALAGFLVGLFLYAILLPLPLPRWPNARGYFMIAGVTIGALAGLACAALGVVAFFAGGF